MAAASRGSGRVDAVTVGNPTGYPAIVDVRGGDWSGWLRLGRVPPESETTIDEVLDAGDRWTFRFSHAGQTSSSPCPAAICTTGTGGSRCRYPSLTGCSDVASTCPGRVSSVDERTAPSHGCGAPFRAAVLDGWSYPEMRDPPPRTCSVTPDERADAWSPSPSMSVADRAGGIR